MTSPDVGVAIETGAATAVFACGAVEQHGPHLPMFMDAEHGTWLAEEVARRLGNALVAPTIRIGCSDHHMAFAGSLTVRSSTLEALCTDYCTSLAAHGFRRILIIPTHGGNFAPIAEMLPRLQAAAGTDCSVRPYTEIMELMEVWRDVVEMESGLGDRVGGHADIAETSVMLGLHPHLVQQERAEAGLRSEVTAEFFARIIREGFRNITPNGILGDARGAEARLGERCVAALADRIADRFKQF